MLRVFIFSLFIGAVQPVWAKVTNKDVNNIQKDLTFLKHKEQRLKSEIKKLSLWLYKKENNSSTWRFFWDEELSKEKQSFSVLKKLLNAKLNSYKNLEKKIEDLESSLSLVQLHSKLSKKASKKINLAKQFICKNLPLHMSGPEKMHLKQDFGKKMDSDTGLEWSSQGWWVSWTKGKQVFSCSSGAVLFSDRIKGRGHVLILEHEGSYLSIYGNLDPKSVKKDWVGKAVAAKEVLGTALEDFYFEIRRNSIALDPREVFTSAQLKFLTNKEELERQNNSTQMAR